jgi:hypothetical protein
VHLIEYVEQVQPSSVTVHSRFESFACSSSTMAAGRSTYRVLVLQLPDEQRGVGLEAGEDDGPAVGVLEHNLTDR